MNYVKSNVVMLPTEKAMIGLNNNQLLFANGKKGQFGETNTFSSNIIPQHLYFTTDNEIKRDDWYYSPEYGVLRCGVDVPNMDYKKVGCRKIVASTDESLGLARPSNAFLKKYCESYNYGKAITKVNIECKLYHGIKISPDNTISIAKIEERTYTQKEVDDLLNRNTCEVTAQMINKQIFTKEEVINLILNHSDYVDELYRKYTKNNLLAWETSDTWINENIK